MSLTLGSERARHHRRPLRVTVATRRVGDAPARRLFPAPSDVPGHHMAVETEGGSAGRRCQTPTMIVVQGVFRVHEAERERYLAESAETQRISRSEPGCLEYVLAADPLDAQRVVLSERWSSPRRARCPHPSARGSSCSSRSRRRDAGGCAEPRDRLLRGEPDRRHVTSARPRCGARTAAEPECICSVVPAVGAPMRQTAASTATPALPYRPYSPLASRALRIFDHRFQTRG